VKADEKESFKKIVTPPKLVREHKSLLSYKQYSRFRVHFRGKIGKPGLLKNHLKEEEEAERRT